MYVALFLIVSLPQLLCSTAAIAVALALDLDRRSIPLTLTFLETLHFHFSSRPPDAVSSSSSERIRASLVPLPRAHPYFFLYIRSPSPLLLLLLRLLIHPSPSRQAWAGLAHLARTAVREKTRIAVAYRRWKTRQFHKIILRTWRHQALYGRTDGLYSRAMLAKGLKSQKALSDRLEKLMVAQTVELEECKELIDREILKRFELEGRLQVAMGDIHRQEMFSHHAEQEVKRIEAIVEVRDQQGEAVLLPVRVVGYTDSPLISILYLATACLSFTVFASSPLISRAR